ncbi:hypothetical protein MPS_2608 [Mycobacterium pseudoshottsii JCM 15466]|nr:hypothetical protein MPS_2608 [Mycobacterium pseudoshottsii JCM 15466]
MPVADVVVVGDVLLVPVVVVVVLVLVVGVVVVVVVLVDVLGAVDDPGSSRMRGLFGSTKASKSCCGLMPTPSVQSSRTTIHSES